MTKEIQLTQGKVTIVDAADYEHLSQYKWCATRCNNTWYAIRREMRNGKRHNVYMHRVILGAKPGVKADHKNMNGLDNRRDNLRSATTQQNAQNSGIRSNNTSGYKGVSFDKSAGMWKAQIWVDGKNYSLGRYDTPGKAALVYDAAALRLHGEFARTNAAIAG